MYLTDSFFLLISSSNFSSFYFVLILIRRHLFRRYHILHCIIFGDMIIYNTYRVCSPSIITNVYFNVYFIHNKNLNSIWHNRQYGTKTDHMASFSSMTTRLMPLCEVFSARVRHCCSNACQFCITTLSLCRLMKPPPGMTLESRAYEALLVASKPLEGSIEFIALILHKYEFKGNHIRVSLILYVIPRKHDILNSIGLQSFTRLYITQTS